MLNVMVHKVITGLKMVKTVRHPEPNLLPSRCL